MDLLTEVPDDWPQFVAWASAVPSGEFIFRGQARSDWTLASRLGRVVAGRDPGAWRDIENRAIGMFVAAARQHRRDLPEESDLVGWLGLMQHYGAPTRLMDWTESPFIAAWFALSDAGASPHCSIYALNAGAIRSRLLRRTPPFGRNYLADPQQTLVETLVERENWILRRALVGAIDPHGNEGTPIPLLPVNPDPRMRAQRGLFTVTSDLKPIAEVPSTRTMIFREPDEPPPPDGVFDRLIPLLTRINLPAQWRQQALETLRNMGISDETLFPGLDGLGRYIRRVFDSDLGLTIHDMMDDRMSPPYLPLSLPSDESSSGDRPTEPHLRGSGGET